MTPEDSRELYAQWAPTYDKTFIEDTKYIYPAKIAEVLAKHMPADRSFTVIDIGCGTGAVGEEIAKIHPLSVIEGVDISPEMLAVAASKVRSDGSKLYEDLHEADLTSTIYFAANHFDFFVLRLSDRFAIHSLGDRRTEIVVFPVLFVDSGDDCCARTADADCINQFVCT